jgi:hypothetical protein
VQLLVPEQVHDIGDVGVEIQLQPGEMHALAEAGERHRVDAAPHLRELKGDQW